MRLWGFWICEGVVVVVTLFGAVAASTSIQFEKPQKDSRYEEDQEVPFTCRVVNALPDTTVTWMVRDPTTKTKLFYTYSIFDETRPERPDQDSKSFFKLVMRRDFSGKEVVCKCNNGQEAALTLREIIQKIPIKKVEFQSSDLIRGVPLQLKCEVISNAGDIVRIVDFRKKGMMTSAKTKETISNTTFRYIWMPDNPDINKANVEEHDGMEMECMAAKDGLKSRTGNVVSRSKRITVHYFDETNETDTMGKAVNISKDKNITTSFNVSCNPEPEKKYFSVIQNGARGTRKNIEILDFIVTNSTGKYRYYITVTFKPSTSGRYNIEGRTKAISKAKTSQSLIVNLNRQEHGHGDDVGGDNVGGDDNPRSPPYRNPRSPPPTSPPFRTILIVGIPVGAIAFIVAILLIAIFWKKSRKQHQKKSKRIGKKDGKQSEEVQMIGQQGVGECSVEIL